MAFLRNSWLKKELKRVEARSVSMPEFPTRIKLICDLEHYGHVPTVKSFIEQEMLVGRTSAEFDVVCFASAKAKKEKSLDDFFTLPIVGITCGIVNIEIKNFIDRPADLQLHLFSNDLELDYIAKASKASLKAGMEKENFNDLSIMTGDVHLLLQELNLYVHKIVLSA